MKRYMNVGRIDQVLRIVISLILLYITVIEDSIIDDDFSSTVIITIACLNIIVSLVRVCPLYIFADICTCSKKENKLK